MQRIIYWLLFMLAVMLIITGLGITEYRTVTTLTFGLLDKPAAFRLHTWLWIPFITLLLFHVLYPRIARKKKSNNR